MSTYKNVKNVLKISMKKINFNWKIDKPSYIYTCVIADIDNEAAYVTRLMSARLTCGAKPIRNVYIEQTRRVSILTIIIIYTEIFTTFTLQAARTTGLVIIIIIICSISSGVYRASASDNRIIVCRQ